MAQSPPETPSTASSSSAPSPPAPPRFYGTHPAQHYGALAVGILAGLSLALPPRRLDTRNAVMGLFCAWSAEQVVHDLTGAGPFQRAARRVGQLFDTELPEPARRNKVLMQAERARREAAGQHATAEEQAGAGQGANSAAHRSGSWTKQARDADWKEERARKEKEAFESGKGISGLIMDQIWEVWNQEDGRKKKAEGKEETNRAGGRDPKKSE